MSIKQIKEEAVPGSGEEAFSQEDDDLDSGTDFSSDEDIGQFGKTDEALRAEDTSEEDASENNLMGKLKSSEDIVSFEELDNLDLDKTEIRSELEQINAEQVESGFESLEEGLSESLKNSIEKALASGNIHQFENLKERIDRLRDEFDSDSVEEVQELKTEVKELQDNMEMISDLIIDSAGEGNLQDSLDSASSDEIEDLRSEIEEIREDLANLSDFVVEMS